MTDVLSVLSEIGVAARSSSFALDLLVALRECSREGHLVVGRVRGRKSFFAMKGEKIKRIEMKDPDNEFKEALMSIGHEFKSNELAYLATTMKVEGPFRDRLAFNLHGSYQADGFVVAREWNRVDLAILDSAGSPFCLVELKAMYTFDAFSNLRFFTDATSADEIKAQRLAEMQTSVYSLLLVTHFASSVLERFMKPVKYSAAINKAIAKHGSAASVREKAAVLIDENLADRKVIVRGEIAAGTAFGLDVSVLYWLVRNDKRLNPN